MALFRCAIISIYLVYFKLYIASHPGFYRSIQNMYSAEYKNKHILHFTEYKNNQLLYFTEYIPIFAS